MRYMSLFCGVGMFDYSFTQLGWTPVVASDNDAFCKRVYQKHYPGAEFYDDVRDITYERLQEDGIVSDTNHTGITNRRNAEEVAQQIDVICGGFP